LYTGFFLMLYLVTVIEENKKIRVCGSLTFPDQ
jgi:hypothetical protein